MGNFDNSIKNTGAKDLNKSMKSQHKKKGGGGKKKEDEEYWCKATNHEPNNLKLQGGKMNGFSKKL